MCRYNCTLNYFHYRCRLTEAGLMDSKFDPNQLIDSLNININQLQSKNWRITNDIYNSDYQFIVIHGIKSKLEIDSIKQKLPHTTLKLLDSNNFVTLSAQFRKIFIEKSWPRVN